MNVLNVDFYTVINHLVYILIAYILSLPIGWDREKRARSAGLRTFPLVAAGACGFMLIALDVMQNEEAKARVFYGIITGLGFIGGGAIIKGKGSVTGTATAASIWNTGAMGLAVAWNRIDIAILLSLLNFLTLSVFRPLKKRLDSEYKDRKEES